MNEFEERVAPLVGDLQSSQIEILQVNLGLRCNQRCKHCHLGASPQRDEMMDWQTMELVLEAAQRTGCRLVDITGGAPELNPNFRRFIRALQAGGHAVQVRTNFTVFLEPGMEGLPEFYRKHRVQLVGSMPCYLEENVRSQRGTGVYEKSVEVISYLNELGYGLQPRLSLDLVYNPGGAVLPPEQSALEADYRRELAEQFGISFNRLYTITNMPMGRFLTELRRLDQEQQYLQLLRDSFNPQTIDDLMCRHQLSVGWEGTLYDCDFNLALRLPVGNGAPSRISDFDPEPLARRRIVTGEHCFGCTAGFGSSCRGALAASSPAEVV